jgi:hypothetical protein
MQTSTDELPDVVGDAAIAVTSCVRNTIEFIEIKFRPASFLNDVICETASARGMPSVIKRPGVSPTAHGAFKDPNPFLCAVPILAMHNVLATGRDFSSIANLAKASGFLGRHAPQADVTTVINLNRCTTLL